MRRSTDEAPQSKLAVALPLGLDTLVLLALMSSWTRLSLMTRLVPVPPDSAGAKSDSEFVTKWFVMSLLLLGVAGYVVADIIRQLWPTAERWTRLAKWLVVLLCVFLLDLGPTVTWIDLRQQESPWRHIHDGALQVEEAIKLLLNGRNPYGFDYRTTDLAKWGYEGNPALYHFVYLPWLLLCSTPFHLLANATVGWFDVRFVFILCTIGCLVLLPKLARTDEGKLCAVMFGLLNPSLALYLPEGRNDIFTLCWLLAAVVAVQRGRVLPACALLGLTCASKQSAWPLVPVWFAWLWMSSGGRRQGQEADKGPRPSLPPAPASCLLACFVPFAACMLPFFLWNPTAFLDDTIRYQTGTVAHPFPIRGLQGFGFGSWVLFHGWVRHENDYFPFWLPQLLVGAPLLALILAWLKQRATLGRVLIGYALLLFVMQYFARAFHDNYWGFIVAIAGVGCVLEAEGPIRGPGGGGPIPGGLRESDG